MINIMPLGKFKLRVLQYVLFTSTIIFSAAQAEYNPKDVYIEPESIAQYYAKPDINFTTPAFQANKEDFTSYAEMMDFIDVLQERSAALRVKNLGLSQEQRFIPALVFSQPALGSSQQLLKNGKPTVLIMALQHGNEPASAEAALVYAEKLTQSETAAILKHINIVIIPRANPDGGEAFTRDLANGINLNRDHLLVMTPEGRALAKAMVDFQPEVVIDLHEFSVAGRWVDKFNSLQWQDVAIQYATIANVLPALQDASEYLFRSALVADFDKANLKHDWYFTTNANVNEKRVSMGGVGPDVGRNIAGLRNAIAFLIETRGIGLGKAHFERRVLSQLVAIESIVKTTANNSKAVLALNNALKDTLMAQVGQGELIVLGEAQKEQRDITLFSLEEEKPVTLNIEWDNALKIQPTLLRDRPYGYLLPAGQKKAVEHLVALGIEVQQLKDQIELPVTAYKVLSLDTRQKTDVTGRVNAQANDVIALKTELVPATFVTNTGDFYISLQQPLANLVIAALEPESQSSYVSNQLINVAAESSALLPVFRLHEKINLVGTTLE